MCTRAIFSAWDFFNPVAIQLLQIFIEPLSRLIMHVHMAEPSMYLGQNRGQTCANVSQMLTLKDSTELELEFGKPKQRILFKQQTYRML